MMKSVFVSVCLMLVAVMGFVSCGDDDYEKENTAFIESKKVEKGTDGELLYKQVVVGGQTALYRIVKKEGNHTTPPALTTTVSMTLKGNLIDDTNFQPESDMSFAPNQLIPGLAYIMIETCIGETVEAILPASLGYGSEDSRSIPGHSTLIFTYTMTAYK